MNTNNNKDKANNSLIIIKAINLNIINNRHRHNEEKYSRATKSPI